MNLREIVRKCLGKRSEDTAMSNPSEGARLIPIGGVDPEKGVFISPEIEDAMVLDSLRNHLMQHIECMQPSRTGEHRPGSEVWFECVEETIEPEWIPIEPPFVGSPRRMIDVINEHNRLVCENARREGRKPDHLYTDVIGELFQRGWGYNPYDYCLVLFDWSRPWAEANAGICFENLFIERRIYEELVFDRSVPKPDLRCLRWEVKRVTVFVLDALVLDRIEFVVTGFTPESLKILEDDFDAHNGYDGDPEGAAGHIRLANRLRTGYQTECWFEISSFFFRPDGGKGPMGWGPKPYEDAKLGVVFPVALGGLKMGRGCRYQTEELGYSLEYSTGNGRVSDGDVYCTLYVYTNGESLPENGVSEPVERHFTTVAECVVNAKDVCRCCETDGRFRMERSGLDCRWASFDVHCDQSDDVHSSLVMLTAFRGHYIKLRCTYPKWDGNRLPDSLMPFLSAVDDLLSAQVQPALADC